MTKITMAVLATKIDNLNEKVEDYQSDLKDIRLRCDLNTEFRNKAIGVWTVIATIGGIAGGFALWILNKVWK